MKAACILCALVAAALVVASGAASGPSQAPTPESCPAQASISLRNVPKFLGWGNRATIRITPPASADVTGLRLAWADSGETFAEATQVSDFWIEAEHPDRSIGFVVSWTAAYFDDQSTPRTCSGTLGPITISSGLDKVLLINKSFAAIKLNQTEARVRKVLGAPSRVTNPYRGLRVYSYRAWDLRVWFYKAAMGWRVQSVRTTSRAFRTDRAVGVGTSFRTLKQRHRGFTCFLGGDTTFQLCLARQLAPQPTTMFQGRRGTITSAALTLMGD